MLMLYLPSDERLHWDTARENIYLFHVYVRVIVLASNINPTTHESTWLM